MSDQFNENIPSVTNQITDDIADIAETLGFLKDCFEAIATGWSDSDASSLQVDSLATVVTRAGITQGRDISEALHRKIVEIGDWNMDTTAAVDIASGVTFTKIRSVNGIIRNDADTLYFPIAPSYSVSGSINPVTFEYASTPTTIRLARVAGGAFDSTNYNSTSYNRGWLVVEYVD